MESINYEFSSIKTTWGILIIYKGYVLKKVDNDNYLIDLGKNIFLKMDVELSDELKNQLINGMKFRLKMNDLIFFNDKKIVVIDEVRFNFTDFQIEGLFYGASNWISEVLRIDKINLEITFSKEKNKYDFKVLS